MHGRYSEELARNKKERKRERQIGRENCLAVIRVRVDEYDAKATFSGLKDDVSVAIGVLQSAQSSPSRPQVAPRRCSRRPTGILFSRDATLDVGAFEFGRNASD